MKKWHAWMYLFILLGHSQGSISLQAQEAPPQPPFVAPVPPMAHWTIVPVQEVKEGDDQAKGTPTTRLKTMSCRKTGKMKQDILTFNDGTVSEYWQMDQYLLATEYFDKKNILVSETSQMDHDISDQNALVSPGFVGVRWLSKNNFDKTVKFQEKECHHFVNADKSLEAWIDTKSKLPVAFRKGGILYTYTFSEPPASMLVLPEMYQKAYDDYVKLAAHRKQLEKDLGGN